MNNWQRKREIHTRQNYEKSLLTDMFPSWFFLSTCSTPKSALITRAKPNNKTNLRDSELEVFLRDMLSPFAQRVHAGLRANTPHFGARALAHLLRECAQVDTAL